MFSVSLFVISWSLFSGILFLTHEHGSKNHLPLNLRWEVHRVMMLFWVKFLSSVTSTINLFIMSSHSSHEQALLWTPAVRYQWLTAPAVGPRDPQWHSPWACTFPGLFPASNLAQLQYQHWLFLMGPETWIMGNFVSDLYISLAESFRILLKFETLSTQFSYIHPLLLHMSDCFRIWRLPSPTPSPFFILHGSFLQLISHHPTLSGHLFLRGSKPNLCH